MNEASNDVGKINLQYEKLKVFSDEIKISLGGSGKRLDQEYVENLMGSKIVQEVTVLPPNQSNNKGSRKRLVNPVEKTLGGKKKNC